MDTAKKKRIERKKKLKRVLNFDAEFKFLQGYWEFQKKHLSIDEFKVLAIKTLIETEQVSELVLEYFIDELRIKDRIEEKEKVIVKLRQKRGEIDEKIDNIEDEIRDLERSMEEEEDEEEGLYSFSSRRKNISDC